MRPYAIYYGWLTDGAHGEPNATAHAIAAAGTPLLIAQGSTAAPAGHNNISAQVLSLMHCAGVEVYGYVATGYGRADLAGVRREIADNLAGGVDGIFFDEADPLLDEDRFGYYTMLARQVRDSGKRIIANTGRSRCGERIMQIADRLMVEHQWRSLAADSPWMTGYACERFMGVSSNEENAMGYVVDEQRAIDDARNASQAGIGWHTATDRYIELPDWFAGYVRAAAR